ncbi:MAG: thioredoxin family protein [Elusimicrobia bacterium]|nr:thioredoxin family protein [Elusimicrobiota bacterium]
MHRIALALLMSVLAAPLRAEGTWEPSLAKALSQARASRQRVLAAFTAPWCYSCYYMEKNVLGGPAFAAAARGLVLARIDVDKPEGRALKEKYRVRFLPTFLVLDAAGKETDRILGEQREADFIARLGALAAAASAEDKAVAKLESLVNGDDLAAAAAFAAKPGPARPEALRARADWRKLELRLALKRRPTAKDLAAMVELNDGCDLAYDLEAALREKLPQAPLAELRPKLEAWAGRRTWAAPGERCADFRGGVEAMAGYYEGLGDPAAKAALLDRAALLTASESDRAGLGQNRNLDDNRRFFLEAAGKDKEVEALYPRLVAAYPADYVYAYRFAKWLAGRGRPADALPWIEKADALCYGANRLSVTKVRAEVLDALGRRPEAAALVRREIKAYRASLPDETKALEQLLASWSARKG